MSPRCGVVKVTAPPRFCRSQARNVSASSGSRSITSSAGINGGLIVELLQERGQGFLWRRIARTLHDEELAPDEFAATEEEDLRAGLVVLARQRDHVLVFWPGGVDDLLFGQHLLDGAYAITKRRRPLELQVLRRLLHLAPEVIQRLVVLALEEENDLADHRIVLLAAGAPDARRVAAMNVVLRAWPIQTLELPSRRWILLLSTRRRPGGGVVAAGAKREDLVHQVQRRVNRAGIGIRAKVAVAVTFERAHAVDAWKVFGQ